MVSQCANPKCSKPLVYLREGRIFIFDMPVATPSAPASGRGSHRLEHFWLCGDCSGTLLLQQNSDGALELVPRFAAKQIRRTVEADSKKTATSALAS
jgi:hypothetical protein